jgi:pyridoxine 5-phosphate synthase
MHQKLRIGVNIDHIATLRQQRFTEYPDPLTAALLLEQHGVDSITVHLREDRRHIQDQDVNNLKQYLKVPINLEMAATEEMQNIACKVQPAFSCLVPEKREELTTEGGLDLLSEENHLIKIVKTLKQSKIRVSLFIDPDLNQIDKASEIGVNAIELNTGAYCEAISKQERNDQLERVRLAAKQAFKMGISVHAGHGLNYLNVREIAKINYIEELNIGHAIIARSIFDGLGAAYTNMKEICLEARSS